MRTKPVDKIFLGIVAILLVVGLLIFISASLGLLARTGATFGSVALTQFIAVFLGSVLAWGISKIHYTFWRRYSFWIFLFSLLLTLLVFVPHIGLEFGGGRRWIGLGPISFQPGEFLKIAFVIYLAAWLSGVKEGVTTFKQGMLPIIIFLVIVGAIL